MACLTYTQDTVFAPAKDQKTNWFMVVEVLVLNVYTSLAH